MKKQNDISKRFEDLTKQGKARINLICEKAAKLFSEKGFHASSLADVSRVTGISKGGIYHYFSSKEEILFLIVTRHMDKLLEGLQEKLDNLPTPQDKIRFFIHWHIQLYSNYVFDSKIILHEVSDLPPNYWKIIRTKTKGYAAILKSTVRDFLGKKDVNSPDVKVVTYSLLGMCNWIYWWYNPKGPTKPDELAEKIYKMFIGNLKAQ